MTTKFYALEPNGPKRVILSWDRGWQGTTLIFDGKRLGFPISDQEALKAGIPYFLPDGTRLDLQLIKVFFLGDFQLLRNGVLLPGSKTRPHLLWNYAQQVVFLIAGFNIVVSLLPYLNLFSLFKQFGFYDFTLVTGFIYLGLGYGMRRRIWLALVAAFGFFLLDTVFFSLLNLPYFLSASLIVLPIRAALLYYMWQGLKVFDELENFDHPKANNLNPTSHGRNNLPLWYLPNLTPSPSLVTEEEVITKPKPVVAKPLVATLRNMPAPDYSTAFEQAVTLAQDGQTAEAYTQLAQLVLEHPEDSNLLLWLIYTAPNTSEARYWLNRLSLQDLANPLLVEVNKWLIAQEAAAGHLIPKATAIEPAQPRLILERYELRGELGRGGFAKVNLAYDQRLERMVALKVFSACNQADPQRFLGRFEEETYLLANLKHPNIIEIYDSHLDPSSQEGYLIMPVAEGGTLAALLDQRPDRKLSLSEAKDYFLQIANGLSYAHHCNIIHRDLKPQNLLFMQGRVLISDFGLAKVLDPLHTHIDTHTVGTYSYMAPEQFEERASKPSDVYALGIIFYEMLAGKPPFSGSAAWVMNQHLTKALPDLRMERPELPYSLISFLAQLTAKNPEDRPTASQIPEALEKAFKVESQVGQGFKTVPSPLRREKGDLKTKNSSLIARFRRLKRGWVIALSTIMILLVTIWFLTKGPDLGSEIASFNGHTAAISDLAFSPDGSYLASASQDRSVRLWEPNQGKQVRVIANFNFGRAITALAISPNSKIIATAGAEGYVSFSEFNALWKGGQPLETINHNITINKLAFSPDGKFLASLASDGVIRLWDIEQIGISTNPAITLKNQLTPISALAFSPNNKYLATTGDNNSIKLWDLTTKVGTNSLLPIRTFDGYTSTSTIRTLAFSPDGQVLASGGDDSNIRFWDMVLITPGGRPPATLIGHGRPIITIAFSPDGKTLASGSSDYTLKLWDVGDKRLLTTISFYGYQILRVSFSPNGKILASADSSNTIKLWSALR
ncbi:MAG: serine/threonine-protein kinase [Chloroflexota bacterium]